MKLDNILENLNSFEKNSFLKILDSIIEQSPNNQKAIEKILSEQSKDIRSIDNINVAKVFDLVTKEFTSHIKSEFLKTSSQLDILIDIISRDGNAIMKLDWFARLYEKELKELNKKVKAFKNDLEQEKSDIAPDRRRDYRIYLSCLTEAYENDVRNNQDKKITSDELSILNVLAKQLGLSQEEVKLINYLIIPVKPHEIDQVVNDLKSIGVIFYSKKSNTIYVADEMVRVLRDVRGKEVADKYYRRVLKAIREPQINLICSRHGIDRKLPLDQKIKHIINEGISFSDLLIEDVHRTGTTLTAKKQFINDLCEKQLEISPALKGTVLEDKVANLIQYFHNIEQDEKVGISIDGYEKLLIDLNEALPKLNQTVRAEFELQDEHVLNSEFLLNYNVKPRDILELLTKNEQAEFCKLKEIKSRGNLILNILDCYTDVENIMLENYENIAFRNLKSLKENGVNIKESLLGVKFEELTKKIFEQLGFHVDEALRKQINSRKDIIDIILNVGNNEIILIECKTHKERGYNKFSSVSKQMKSYAARAKEMGVTVKKSILIAPEFSDDFVNECGMEYELNLSLIPASTLIRISEGFKKSKLNKFPQNLLMRDILIHEDIVLKAINK